MRKMHSLSTGNFERQVDECRRLAGSNYRSFVMIDPARPEEVCFAALRRNLG
jgi:hypothetical protein